MNHLKFLQLYFGVQMAGGIPILIGIMTFNNLGIKFRRCCGSFGKCLDYVLFVILATFRTAIVIFVIHIYPKIWEWIVFTWNLNTMNTW